MKYLITGAGGQLGKEWVEKLAQIGEAFTSYTSKHLDITNTDLLRKVLTDDKPDILINCAAYTAVDLAEDEPEKADLINNTSLIALSALCNEFEIKLIHYSTDYVFSGEGKNQKNYPNGYPENALKKPINSYGNSKAGGEEQIINSGCDFLIIRVAWLCGRHGNNFVKTMLRLSESKSEINIVNDQFGVPTYCFDVVEHTMQLINKNLSGIYHLGSKGCISWFDFAKKLFSLSSKKIQVNPISSDQFKSKAKRPTYSKLDTSKFENNTGVKMQSWETGLVKLLSQL